MTEVHYDKWKIITAIINKNLTSLTKKIVASLRCWNGICTFFAVGL